jgi:excisionase family DNA binding protein
MRDGRHLGAAFSFPFSGRLAMSTAVETAALPQRLLTVKDLAAMAGVAENTIRHWIARGHLPRPIKLGKVWRWHPDAINKFLAREG